MIYLKDDALWRMMPRKRGQKNMYAHRRYAPQNVFRAKLDDGPIMVEMVELSRKSITKRENKVRQLSSVQACAQKKFMPTYLLVNAEG